MSNFSENNTYCFGQFKGITYFCGAKGVGIDLVETSLKLEKRLPDNTYIIYITNQNKKIFTNGKSRT